jgi:hypothetical protein
MPARALGSLQTIGLREQQDRILPVSSIYIEENASSKIPQGRTTSLSSAPRQ